MAGTSATLSRKESIAYQRSVDLTPKGVSSRGCYGTGEVKIKDNRQAKQPASSATWKNGK